MSKINESDNATGSGRCRYCGMVLDRPAVRFLHEAIHDEPWEGLGNARNLRSLPFALIPRIALLLDDYRSGLATPRPPGAPAAGPADESPADPARGYPGDAPVARRPVGG